MANGDAGTTKDKIAIITGGSRGLGRNIAINLAWRGVDVIFTHHSNEREARAVVTEIESLGKKASAHQLGEGFNWPLVSGLALGVIYFLLSCGSSPNHKFRRSLFLHKN